MDDRQIVGPNDILDTRMKSFELAFRMQSAAPELVDLAAEIKTQIRTNCTPRHTPAKSSA